VRFTTDLSLYVTNEVKCEFKGQRTHQDRDWWKMHTDNLTKYHRTGLSLPDHLASVRRPRDERSVAKGHHKILGAAYIIHRNDGLLMSTLQCTAISPLAASDVIARNYRLKIKYLSSILRISRHLYNDVVAQLIITFLFDAHSSENIHDNRQL